MRRISQFAWLAALAAWAGLAVPNAVHARDSVVVFNEVHYRPSGDEASLEWVEVHNQMAVDVDMSAWRIDGGIQFDFELDTVIPGGGYIVIARDPQALRAATGYSEALGPFIGALDNGGEEILLYKHNRLKPNPDLEGRRVMDRLDYGDNHPWPAAPDGSGVTLAKRDPDTGTGQPANWTWSAQVGGTPGSHNFPSPDDVALEIVRVMEVGSNWRFNEAGESYDAAWAQTTHPVNGNWREGPGALGFEAKIDDIIGTPLIKPTLNNPYVATHYFEADLELTQAAVERLAHLDIEHLIDDGAVFYINGVEAHRHNMPAGAINFETLASSGGEAEWLGVSRLDAASLLAGTNRISVEVHQSSFGSSDVAFGLTLDLALGPPPAVGSNYSGLHLNEIGAADGHAPLVVELHNAGTSPIPLGGLVVSVSGDSERERVLPDGAVLEAGGYFVLDDQLIGKAIPISDQDRLFLFSPGRQEVIDARQVSASLRGRQSSGEFAGRWLRPDVPTFGAVNTFALQDGVVINEIFYHGYPERGFPDIPPQLGNVVVLPIASEWRYLENISGEGLPADWAASAHTDWPAGPALLGREPAALEEPIRTPLSFSRPQVTYYFETEFEFSGDVDSGLTLRHMIDDGAVFYLNGVEIARFNMPAGTIAPDTLASPSVSNAESVTVNIPDASVLAGGNRLAVEVHQANVGSSDIIFGVEVLGKSVIAPGIPGRPFSESEEEWIELFNRGAETVDISGWRLEDGVDYKFPVGTVLEPGGHLVIAEDADFLRAHYPQTNIAGSFGGGLSNRGERLVLSDAAGNPADEVVYADSGRWPTFPDGGGSSLELRDAAADNRQPEAWAASDESGKSTWQTYTYRGVAVNDRVGNNVYHEFLLGLLDAGEILLDDVSVVEDPDGAAIEFIQNGSFQSDSVGSAADKWRAVGTHGSHERTVVVADPDNPANKCLHVVATGPTGDKHNKIETTYANRERAQVGTEYQISFRARWLRGSNQVNTRLYFNYVQKTTLLSTPMRWGTPGAPNSTGAENIGPMFSRLRHEPAVPDVDQPVAVNIVAEDPDGIASMTLFHGIEGENFTPVTMTVTRGATDFFKATIPGQSAGSVVQFYVEGVDNAGAVTTFPAQGANSRALLKVDDRRARLENVHNFRIIMLNDDRTFLFRNTNRMSNDRIGATVIYDEKTVFHNVGARLKGSAFGRYNAQHYGFNIEFDRGHLFRGVHRTISIERSPPLKESLAKHLLTQAGGPGFSSYEDVGRVITPNSRESGPCLFSMARQTAEFWEGLFGSNSADGTLFNHELLYNPNGASGGVEGLKINNPYNHTGGKYDFIDRGGDKEPYRFGFQIRSNRDRDDYSAIVGAGKALALSGQEMEDAAAEFIDLDQWARGFAALSLVGNDDTYTRVWEHNLRYYQRPTDGRLIVLPWDLDRGFQLAASAPAIGGNATGKLLKRPLPRRLFNSHALDMIDTTFNADYATRWADHLSSLTGSSYRSEARFIGSRANFITGRLPDAVPFEITTNDGADFSVTTSSAALQGNGWINVRSIRRPDGGDHALRWIDDGTWEISIALQAGENTVLLEAFDLRGESVGADSIRITNTGAASAPNASTTAISEIHYHPADPTVEEIAAGFTDANQFEFLELTNISDHLIDLSGARFTDGIAFVFPAAFPALAPSERILLVANAAAFQFRYGGAAAEFIVGEYTGNLRNSGEMVRLEDAAGAVVLEFAFNDRPPWPESPDGSGASLVLIAPGAVRDHADPFSWRPSTTPGGNPGATDRIPFNGDASGLFEYALVDSAQPFFTTRDGALALAYTQPLGADDVAVSVEFSNDLKTWATAAGEEFIGSAEEQPGTMTLFFSVPDTDESVPFRFARLQLRRR